MKEYIDFWKNYTNFSGKTDCRGYWMYVLINSLLMMGAFIVLEILFMIAAAAQSTTVLAVVSRISGLLMFGYMIASIIPGLALTVRRLRDAGKKWTYIFMSLIPIAGAVIMLLTLAKPSVPEPAIPRENYYI